MSIITDKLKQAKQIEFLVDLDFSGMIRRYAMRNISVPNSGGDPLLFEGLITNQISLGSSYNLNSNTYSLSDVQITIANKARLQDQETVRKLDGGAGTIRLWCEGLDWTDIDVEGIVFKGYFKKDWHDKYRYSFRLVDPIKSASQQIPSSTINADTWSSHRTEGGGGSVAGLPQAIVYGDFPKGIPLKCVDTSAYKYLACAGVVKSADADYTATTENVYDKDGAVIGAANYTFYPGGVDGQGNVAAYFDAISDYAASEPLSCSLRGIKDGSGEITGTADALVEHPTDILYHLLANHTTLDSDDIDITTVRTMRSLLPGLKFASIVNSQTGSINIIDRILKQCQCARIQRRGKAGVMTFDTDAVNIGHCKRYDQVAKTVRLSKTPEESICNDLKVYYALNPTTGKYEGELTRDRTNSPDCKKSYYDYGAREQQILKLPDVQQEATAIACASRYVELRAYRHDIVTVEAPYWQGWDTLEGDAGLLTIEEGPSTDGTGWVDEKCILLDRKFQAKTILQKWWRIAT